MTYQMPWMCFPGESAFYRGHKVKILCIHSKGVDVETETGVQFASVDYDDLQPDVEVGRQVHGHGYFLGRFVCPHQDGDYICTVYDMKNWMDGHIKIIQQGQSERHSMVFSASECLELAKIIVPFAGKDIVRI